MKKIIIILTCVLSIFFSSGCTKLSPKIEIFRVSRDFFYSFLESPSMDMMDSNDIQKFVYSKGNRWHIRSGTTRFELRESFLNFVGSKIELKKFLTNHGNESNFQKAVIIDAPNIPLTIWINTVEGDVYITVDVNNDTEYTYKFYTSYDYVNKYGITDASLNINGTNIESACLPKIYSEYADIPLITVLESLGATLIYQADEKIQICVNERIFVLNLENIELYEVGKENTNMFHKDGGSTFIYPYGNELMIDSFTLDTVLRMMDEPITITCDKENKIVLINTKK